MSKICLYIDEDASRNSFVLALRNLNFDVITTAEAGNLGLTDLEQLIWSTARSRAIYTFNVKDYCRLHNIYIAEAKQHSGIIVAARQSYSVGEQLKGLQNLISTTSSEETNNRLIFLGTYLRP